MTHSKMARNLLLGILFLLISLQTPGAGQKSSTIEGELPRFKELARYVANLVHTERPDPKMSEAMDILLRAAKRAWNASPGISDDQMEKQLSAFSAAANPGRKDYFSSDPRWFSLHTTRQGKRFAIAFTYGPVSRLAVFDAGTGQSMPMDRKMAWLYPWMQEPHFLSDGSLLVLSHSVQDMGIRIGRRVDTLVERAGQWKHIQSLTRQSSLDLDRNIKVQGQKLSIQSLDDFQSFFVSSSTPIPLRVETFRLTQGKLRLLHTRLHNEPLRSIDSWIIQARTARRPASYQKIIQNHFPDREMLFDYYERLLTQRQVALSLEFEDITLRFTLENCAGRWQVRSLKVARKKSGLR